MPKPRLKQNRHLPKYWRYHKGAYSYRIPEQLRAYHNGKKEIALGKTLTAAYHKFAEFYQVQEGLSLMRELFDRYRFEVVAEHASPATRKSKGISLERLNIAMGDNLISIITPQDIYQYRDHVGRVRSKKQANLDLEVLSHCFTKAIEWGGVSDHPMTNKRVVKFSLPGRDRYVEDWELQAWAKVANPFLVVYVVLKGVTGLRQQDLLSLRKDQITESELVSTNIKTHKKVRFPLRDGEQEPTTVALALDAIRLYYAGQNASRSVPLVSPWLFHNRKGEGYYNAEKRTASGFQSIWRRSMDKALAETALQERFTEHDLRAKVGSDAVSLVDAQKLLAHSNAAITSKHYRRKGVVIDPAQGFLL